MSTLPISHGSSSEMSKRDRIARKAALLSVGILTSLGLKRKLIRKIAFNPPEHAGYVCHNGTFYIRFSKTRLARPVDIIPSRSHSPSTYFFQIPQESSNRSSRDFPSSIQDYNLRNALDPNGIPVLCLLPAKVDQNTPVFMFFHGNSTDVGYSFPQAYNLCTKLNVVIILSEYPGYGIYVGSPNQDDVKSSAKRVYRWLTDEVNCSWSNIVVYGQSIGSYPACEIASSFTDHPIRAVVLQSPIASALHVAVPHLQTKSSTTERKYDFFRNYERAKDIPWPILIIHGTKDSFVDIHNAYAIKKYARKLSSKAFEVAVRNCSELMQEKISSSSLAPDIFKEHYIRPSKPCHSAIDIHEQTIDRILEDLSSSTGTDIHTLERAVAERVQMWEVTGAGHSDVEAIAGSSFYKKMKEFLNENFVLYNYP